MGNLKPKNNNCLISKCPILQYIYIYLPTKWDTLQHTTIKLNNYLLSDHRNIIWFIILQHLSSFYKVSRFGVDIYRLPTKRDTLHYPSGFS